MLLKIFLLCLAGFTASIIDCIAGGGGIITVPAYLMAGLSPHLALGTNKFSTTCGALTSSVKFFQSDKLNFKLLKFLIPFSFIGSIVGVNTVLSINTQYLNSLVLILLLSVSIISIFCKNMGLKDNFKGLNKKNIFLGMLFAFVIGFYDGFFGPGTGSFLIFGLITIYGFDFVHAGGNGRVLNFVSNITALVLFAIHGQINYLFGIPVAICVILGARFGTKLAIKNGSEFIKPIFITMSLLLAGKMLYQLI